MKALQYLQKVGAVPESDKWDLLMSLVVLVDGLFVPETIMEPDVIEWTQDAESHDEFNERCNAILFGTSGDVRALFPHVCNQSVSFLKDLIGELLEICVTMHAFAEDLPLKPDNDEWFTNTYNDILQLKGKRKFPSKAAILQFYYSDCLVETGQEVLAERAGTQTEFMEKVAKMQSEFQTFLSKDNKVSVEEVLFENEKTNPFEGGYQVILKIKSQNSAESQVCTLHWAPWPVAKTSSKDPEIIRICEAFTRENTSKWFASVGEEG